MGLPANPKPCTLNPKPLCGVQGLAAKAARRGVVVCLLTAGSKALLLGLEWGYIGVIVGLYWGSIGVIGVILG